MKKQINIEGMSCMHCVMHVKNALMEMNGVKDVKVDLQGKKAVVEMENEIEDTQLKAAIDEVGYDVISIEKL